MFTITLNPSQIDPGLIYNLINVVNKMSISNIAGKMHIDAGKTIDRLPHGKTLKQLHEYNISAQSFVLSESILVERRSLIKSDIVNPDISSYGHLFFDVDFKRYTASEIRASALLTSSVLGDSGLVALEDAILYDSLQSIQSWQDENLAGESRPGEQLFKHPIRLPGNLLLGEWFHGFTGAWRNYSHWMTECLPKLFSFLQLRQHRPDLRLLLPRLCASGFQAETLSLLGISESSVTYLDPGDVVAPEILWYSTCIDWWKAQPFCNLAAQYLVNLATDVSLPAVDGASRLYIHRSSGARRVANFEWLVPILDLFNFKIMDFSAIPLVEQISLMQGAKFVIAEHGAGVCNLLFCQKGTRLIELFNPSCPQPAYWSLSSVSGVDYGFVVGSHSSSQENPTPTWNSNYVVTPQQLNDLIYVVLDGHARN